MESKNSAKHWNHLYFWVSSMVEIKEKSVEFVVTSEGKYKGYHFHIPMGAIDPDDIVADALDVHVTDDFTFNLFLNGYDELGRDIKEDMVEVNVDEMTGICKAEIMEIAALKKKHKEEGGAVDMSAFLKAKKKSARKIRTTTADGKRVLVEQRDEKFPFARYDESEIKPVDRPGDDDDTDDDSDDDSLVFN